MVRARPADGRRVRALGAARCRPRARAQEVLLFPAMKPEEAGAAAARQQAVAGDAAAAAVQQLSVN